MIQKNILLANFLGLEKQEDNTYFDYESNEYINQEDLNYNESWDMLMQVVSEIESVGYIVHIKTAGTLILDKNETLLSFYLMGEDRLNTKIKTVYNACVEFVEWWNEENNKL